MPAHRRRGAIQNSVDEIDRFGDKGIIIALQEEPGRLAAEDARLPC
jgi:hypothetical protein